MIAGRWTARGVRLFHRLSSILLRGGTVVSIKPKVGDFVKGDVLIDGRKISAVEADGQVKAQAQAQVIDATNTIVIPGVRDAHRHSWEGQLRRIIPDGAIAEYMATTHNGFARHYRPHDIYIGDINSRTGCLDTGRRLRDRQLAQLAFGGAFRRGRAGAHRCRHSRRPRVRRAANRRLGQTVAAGSRAPAEDSSSRSTDQLVTLRMFAGMNREHWALARRLGLRITTESNAAGHGVRRVLEGEAAADPTTRSTTARMARSGVAARQGRRRHGERLSAL